MLVKENNVDSSQCSLSIINASHFASDSGYPQLLETLNNGSALHKALQISNLKVNANKLLNNHNYTEESKLSSGYLSINKFTVKNEHLHKKSYGSFCHNSFQYSASSKQNDIPIKVELSKVSASLRRKKIVTVVCYSIILVASILFLAIYIRILEKLSPPLELHELRNLWTFYILFASCIVSFIAIAFTLFLVCCTKTELNRKIVGYVDLILFLSWFAVVFVPLGVGEYVKEGNRGPKHATKFGKYVATVCGRENTEQHVHFNINVDPPLTRPTISPPVLDAAKCEAVEMLITSVYCMYIWILLSFTVSLMGSHFGIGSWLTKTKQSVEI